MFSGDEGIRTPDPLLARQVLSQLSYTPVGSLFLSIFAVLYVLYRSGLKWTFPPSEGYPLVYFII